MISLLLFVGIVGAVFVGFNIGGSSGGVAWGPAVGAGLIKKTSAAALMTGFAFLGGWTVGRNVIATLAEDIIAVSISLQQGVALLFFIGFGILLSNLLSVPVPTSMTTVGAIAGLGLATGQLNFETIGWIATWWVVAPFLGFFVGLIIGRHFYPELNRRFRIASSEGTLLTVDWDGALPTVRLGPNTTPGEVIGTGLVLAVSCYMAFSAGASNIPNAVAPLVSSGALDVDAAIIIATVAIGVGAFTIARRTMESVGTELTDISLFAALIVMTTAASITAGLSYLGVPISLVMATVMTIAGLGWGRATRPIALEDAVRGSLRGEIGVEIALDAVTVDQDPPVAQIGEAEPKKVLEEAGDLFDQQALARYISMWIVGPSVALALSYAYFYTGFIGG
ncbi:MAG: anion permease [Salinibacter sp.]